MGGLSISWGDVVFHGGTWEPDRNHEKRLYVSFHLPQRHVWEMTDKEN